jgi:hypothetical protein
MAIPGSGAISMSMFNTELGRTSNTANSSLAGGTTPAVGSLFWLANQSGSLNQTAPHAMSEWYGYAASSGTDVYITICDYIQANGFGDVTVSATSFPAVDTNVTVYWQWVGDLSSTITGTTTITSGNTFADTMVGGANAGEYFSYWGYLYFSPNPSPGGQNYYDSYCY